MPIQDLKDLYEVKKTVRFGLQDYSTFREDKNSSHNDLKSITRETFSKLRGKYAKQENASLGCDLVGALKEIVDSFDKLIFIWDKCIDRTDVIMISKDLYGILSKKAKFKYKKLESQNTKLSQNKIIPNYWREIVLKTKNLQADFKIILEQYDKAVRNQNMAHKKPDVVTLRKSFLSLSRLYKEIFLPVANKQILLAKTNIEINDHNKFLRECFLTEEVSNKLSELEKIISYFEANGTQIPFGIVSLNYFTCDQKPNLYDIEIESAIKKLGLDKIIEKFKEKLSDVEKYFKFEDLTIQEKIGKFKGGNNELSLFEKAQLFKPRLLKSDVVFSLSQKYSKLFLEHKIAAEQIREIFNQIGKTIDIANDYKNCNDRENFNFEKYPLKNAFDYVWENLARNYMDDLGDFVFPKKECEKYFENFDLENYRENENFKIYANLLYLTDKLAILEYQNPGQVATDELINRLKGKIKELKTIFDPVKGLKDYVKHLEGCEKWINNCGWNNRVNSDFVKAKQQLGSLRGKMKNEIKKYNDLTEENKKLSIDIGTTIASLREKLNEENNLNIITHYGILIENDNNERYLLAIELSKKTTEENRRDVLKNKIGYQDSGRGYKTREIISLTSKALNKMLRNPKGFLDFHKDDKSEFVKPGDSYYFDGKKHLWVIEKDKDSLFRYVVNCLQNSKMSKDQNWDKFNLNFEKCKNYEDLEKEINSKAYYFKEGFLSKNDIEDLVKNNDCLLFPLVNQNIQKKSFSKESNRGQDNQFTIDFENGLKARSNYKIHPEIKLFYSMPTDQTENNRRGRFQLSVNIGIEYVPKGLGYINSKNKLEISLDKNKQEDAVNEFNKKVNNYFGGLPEYYVFGIDRGIKQLATLCVTNNNREIQSFEIFTKKFNTETKRWDYFFHEKRGILDLTNLRVESDAEKNKYLVDLSSVEVKDGVNKQKIKLKQAAYVRKIQYQMSANENVVLDFIKRNKTDDDIQKNIKELISPYKEGGHYADLPIEKIKYLFNDFSKLKIDSSLSEQERQFLIGRTIELDPTEDLKKGIVANMVGVISYLVEKYEYRVLIAIENLSSAWFFSVDGLSGESLASTKKDKEIDFKKQENLALAGTGTYHFFEMQLFKKLHKMNLDNHLLHLVPYFGGVKNYTEITKLKSDLVYKQFGIIYFVDPKYTSKKCPICGNTNIDRNFKKANIVSCKNCGFISIWKFNQQENLNGEKYLYTNEEVENIVKINKQKISKVSKNSINLELIKNGDDNGAYQIGEKLHRIK